MKAIRAELWLDVAWVVFSALYVWKAQSYPPAGRLIPTVVGVAALIVGLFQLIGNFFPMIQGITHKRKEKQDEGSGKVLPAKEKQEPFSSTEFRRLWIGVAWAVGFLIAILLVGYDIAVPLFFLVYFLTQWRERWKLAIISAIVMGLLTVVVFDHVLALNLPKGIFFH